MLEQLACLRKIQMSANASTIRPGTHVGQQQPQTKLVQEVVQIWATTLYRRNTGLGQMLNTVSCPTATDRADRQTTIGDEPMGRMQGLASYPQSLACGVHYRTVCDAHRGQSMCLRAERMEKALGS